MGCGASTAGGAGAPAAVSPPVAKGAAANAQKPHSITTDAKAIGAALISQAASAAVQQGKEVLLAGVTLHAKQLVQEEVGVDVSGLESEREAQLAELEEQLASGQLVGLDSLDDDEETVVGLIERAARAVAPALVSATTTTTAKVDIQSLELAPQSSAEKALVKYSALGGALVGLASNALATMPFGAPVAAALGVIYKRSVQAAKVSKNAAQLLHVVKACDRQLAAFMTRMRKASNKNSTNSKLAAHSNAQQLGPDTLHALKDLSEALVAAGKLFSQYNHKGAVLDFVVRVVKAGGDENKFATLDKRIHGAMSRVALGITIDLAPLASSDRRYVDDEGAALRRAVCQAAGLPESQAQVALDQLGRDDPGRLRDLMREHCQGLPTRVILSELEALGARVDKLEESVTKLEARLEDIEVTLAELRRRGEEEGGRPPEGMAPYLVTLWHSLVGRVGRHRSTCVSLFLAKLQEWLVAHEQDAASALAEYDAELEAEGFTAQLRLHAEGSDNSNKEGGTAGGGRCLFLDIVVGWLLDSNRDGRVDKSELYRLQLLGDELSMLPELVAEGVSRPRTMLQLLDVLYEGFDRSSLLSVATAAAVGSSEAADSQGPASTGAIDIAGATGTQQQQQQQDKSGPLSPITAEQVVLEGLGVTQVLASYNTAALLDDYVSGSRQWMFDRVMAWLDQRPQEGGSTASSRMFLLLADAGMGKSVFSAQLHNKLLVRANRSCQAQGSERLVAVQHLFKAGQARAGGRAMILCLAAQLVQGPGRVQGMADLLLPVVQESSQQLGLLETFERYLLGPLAALHDQGRLPSVVICLDALDEAEEGGQWQPVAALVAREFARLPPCVRVVLTGRPEVEPFFRSWAPARLLPQASDNLTDMGLVVRARLEKAQVLGPGEEVEEAAQVLLGKSRGQFIYTRFAFQQLATASSWTVAQLRDQLPSGLAGAYSLALGVLQAALRRERPDLHDLLRTRVLPALVAVRTPPTISQLTWLAGVSSDKEADVAQLVEDLLPSLFPMRAGTDGKLRVVPYHKSVTDWLTAAHEPAEWLQPEDVPGPELGVNPSVGHTLAAAAASALVRNLTPAANCLQGSGGSQAAKPAGGAESDASEELLGYALRYFVAHCCLAPGGLQLLSTFILSPGLWEAVYVRGYGPAALRDLVWLGGGSGRHSSLPPEIKDASRWLRLVSSHLASFPGSSLQLMRDSPLTSLAATAAAALPAQPPAQLLDSCRAETWPPLVATLRGHTRGVNSVALTPDGRRLVSGSDDGALKVWDLASGELRASLQGHTGWVSSVAATPDGSTCVSGSGDTTVRVWDLATGELKHTLEGHTECVRAVGITPDGTAIISASDDRQLRVWHLSSGQLRASLPTGHEGAVHCLAITSATGTQQHQQVVVVVVTGSEDMTLRVVDLASGGQVGAPLQGHTACVKCAAISPDRSLLVSGSDDMTVRVWDLLTGTCRATLAGHTGTVSGVAISPDGALLASGSADETIRMWDLASGELRGVLDVPGGDSGWVSSLTFPACDATTLVSGASDGYIRVWDLAAGLPTKEGRGRGDDNLHSELSAVTCPPDGSLVVTASYSGAIRVWSPVSGEQARRWKVGGGWACSLAITPDASTLLTGGSDWSIRVWDMASGEIKSSLKGHSNHVTCLALTGGGGRLLSGSRDRTLRVWELATGEQQAALKDHGGGVMCVTTCMLGDVPAAITGCEDKTIRVWDLASLSLKLTLEGHGSSITHLSLLPDGATLVSGCEDRSVRVWGVETGDCQAVLIGRDADIKRAEAGCWRTSTAAAAPRQQEQRLTPVPSSHMCIDLLRASPSSQVPAALVARVPLLPPLQLHPHFLPIIMSSGGTRLVAFVQGSCRPLVYKLSDSLL